MVTEFSIESQASKELGGSSNANGFESANCNLNPDPDSVESDVPAVSGSKKGLVASRDQQALVHVRYESLPSESIRKLEELLSEWSKWHTEHCSSSKDSFDALESGDETYFPAMNFGTEKATVSFLIDSQARKKLKTECLSLKSESVPLYDREYAFALKPTDGSNEDRGLELLNASRCFNCASYSHSLKDCPKPRDNVVVSNARKEHQSKKKHNGVPHVPIRYYQNTPRGKYDGLKPGALDTETRKLLGLSELEPPPWLNRMRELGYPPGYLDIEDDQLSGITIYADGESNKEIEETAKMDVSEARKKKSVDFPGVNSPIPKDADHNRWAVSQVQQFRNSCAYQSNQWLNCSPELTSRGHSYFQRQQSNSTDGFFSSNAQKLDSFMSNYSGYSHYKESDFARNYECPQMDGMSRGYRSEFISPPGYMRSNENYAPNNNSESSSVDGFSGCRRDHEFDVRAPSTNHSPFSITPQQFANSRQL